MKILLLSQWFQPEPAFKGLPLAKALRSRGHNVEVLTGFPNYPGGKLYPGYRIRCWQYEDIEGIRVVRVPLYPSHDKSGIRRIANYASFSLSSAALGSVLVKRPDVVYVFNLITLSFAASILRARYGCPIVLDIQDLWPESVADSKMLDSRSSLRLLKYWSSWAYASASHLITLSPGMKADIVRRGIKESCASVIYNWCDETNIRPTPRDFHLAAQLGLNDYFVVMFAGTMGAMQKLTVLLDAAEQLRTVAPNIRFVLVGGGIERESLRKMATTKRLSNVLFIDNQPPEKMARILGLADAAIVHLKDSPAVRTAIPSKIQAYMAAGKPIIAGLRGDAATIIHESGAGKVVAPENPQALAAAVIELFKMSADERGMLGKRGLDYYISKMSLKAGVDSIEKVFYKCTGPISVA